MTVEKFNETANKWRIKEPASGLRYEVPKIYLMLIVEKPFVFAQSVHRAIQLRRECENRLRFEAVVDKIVLSEIQKPPQRLRDNIERLLFRDFNRGWIEIFDYEHCTLYQKTLAAVELMQFMRTDPRSFPSIQLPAMERGMKSRIAANNGTKMKTFEESRKVFQRTSLYCCPQAIKIMAFINNECDVVSRAALFHIPTDACSLMEFVDGNDKRLSEISNFLQQKWIDDVVKTVRDCCGHISKGWLDLNVNNWSIYQMSKLYRLIGLIKHRMELAVRVMLRSSLRAFVNHLCQPCESMESIAADFVWGSDLVSSSFSSLQPPFVVELNFEGSELAYTPYIEGFMIEIEKSFSSRLLMTQEIPQIDPYLVTQLKFEKILRLSSVGMMDDEIRGLKRRFGECYVRCLIPLRAYAKELLKFEPFYNLNIPEYVRMLRGNDTTTEEIKEEIANQLKSIDEIEATLPMTIVIGPFQTNVGRMKSELIAKRRDLREKLLAMLTERTGGATGERQNRLQEYSRETHKKVRDD